MKLYLFGGAEVDLGQVKPELKLIEEIINKSCVKQVLHIPFARIESDEKDNEWKSGYFNRNIELNNIEYLDAEKQEDIEKAKNPLIFISGGRESIRLYNMIIDNDKLYNLIKNASIVIGESAGTKVLGEYMRGKGKDIEPKIVKGLGVVKNTIFEPHYTERNRQEQLKGDLEESKMKYGVGIDSLTCMKCTVEEFPNNYSIIGQGKIEIIKNNLEL